MTSVDFDEEVTLRVHVQYHKHAPFSILGFSIRDKTGTDIVGTNTHEENVPLPPRRRGDTVVVDFRQRLPLAPGTYSVSTALAYDREQTELFRLGGQRARPQGPASGIGKDRPRESRSAGRHRRCTPHERDDNDRAGAIVEDVERILRDEVERLSGILDQQEQTIAALRREVDLHRRSIGWRLQQRLIPLRRSLLSVPVVRQIYRTLYRAMEIWVDEGFLDDLRRAQATS